MKCQILLCKCILLLITLFPLCGQPKISLDIGIGFYEPTMTGFDDNELVPFPAGNFINRNILWNVGAYYEFFSNTRVGYNSLTSFDLGRLDGFETSQPVFYRSMRYRMFPLETFFRLRPKIELNFTLTPIWGRGKITLETKPSAGGSGGRTITDDWNDLFNSFGDEDPLEQVASDNNMKSDWFGYSGMIGVRYYTRPWLGLDLKAGFINNSYDKDRWRFQGKRVKGPDLTITDIPVFSLKLIYAFR